jgi:hypothetical protein
MQLLKFKVYLPSVKTKNDMGRPPTRPVTLKDGFYIEVRNKGANSGIKIRSDNSESMLEAAKEYKKSKEVVVLGEHKKGKWVTEQAAPAGKKVRK